MGFYAPAQLERDAREHGVDVLPVRVESSNVDSTLERREGEGGVLAAPALRLGFKLVSSLSKAGAERIEAARANRPRNRGACRGARARATASGEREGRDVHDARRRDGRGERHRVEQDRQ